MIRAVLDVNVLVSGLLSPLGCPRRIIRAWQDGKIELVTAEGILAELDAKLRLPRIRKRLPDAEADRQVILRLLQSQARMVVVPPHERPVVTGDPEDDYVLAAVRLGQVEYLVTGDRRLLERREHRGAKIVSPREFIELLESQAG